MLFRRWLVEANPLRRRRAGQFPLAEATAQAALGYWRSWSTVECRRYARQQLPRDSTTKPVRSKYSAELQLSAISKVAELTAREFRPRPSIFAQIEQTVRVRIKGEGIGNRKLEKPVDRRPQQRHGEDL